MFSVPTATASSDSRPPQRPTKANTVQSAPPAAPYDGFSIVGFILGLTAFFLTGFEIPIVPVLAIIFSGIGLSNTSAGKKKGGTFAVIGLILGIIFLGICILAATGVYKP